MLNEVKLIGRLGADPEIRVINDNTKVATLSIATWESFRKRDGSGWETLTEWHRVVVWNQAAERCEKIKKGNLVLVTGKVKYRSYDDKDGIRRYVTDIVGFVKLMPKTEGTAPVSNDDPPAEPKVSDVGDDNLPF